MNVSWCSISDCPACSRPCRGCGPGPCRAAIFQSVSRNALGSPDIIGFTVGSATGALSVVLIGPLAATGVGMGMGAILGGFVTAAVVMLLAGLGGGATMGQKMVLIGIAVSAMLSSVNDYLITRGDLEKAEAAKTWQHGSLNAISWGQMEVQSIILVIAIPLILMLTRRLRTLELGDDLAAGLGLPVKRSVNLLVAAAVLLVAIAISVAGPSWLPGADCPAAGAPLLAHAGHGHVAFGPDGCGNPGAGRFCGGPRAGALPDSSGPGDGCDRWPVYAVAAEPSAPLAFAANHEPVTRRRVPLSKVPGGALNIF